ncbi:MAG: PIN domain-containing protein [Methylocystaceae bacterium]|jgi:tRNA(fMet)-specific endonuclease VapC|nr:PIN domain-containing protein [Methylocystaceae bacterium]
MRAFLLDASVTFAVACGERLTLNKLARLETGTAALSAIVWSELLAAAQDDARLMKNLDLLRQNLDILPFDLASAQSYGALVPQLTPKRRRVLDRMVAAQALELGARLITLTPDIFSDIPGLTVEDWSIA